MKTEPDYERAHQYAVTVMREAEKAPDEGDDEHTLAQAFLALEQRSPEPPEAMSTFDTAPTEPSALGIDSHGNFQRPAASSTEDDREAEATHLRTRVEKAEARTAEMRTALRNLVGWANRWLPSLPSAHPGAVYTAEYTLRDTGGGTDGDRYRLALEGLTPQGSEYVRDPERCVAYVRERLREASEAKKASVRFRQESGRLREALRDNHVLLRRFQDGETSLIETMDGITTALAEAPTAASNTGDGT